MNESIADKLQTIAENEQKVVGRYNKLGRAC